MHAPHRAIKPENPCERLLTRLLDDLWGRYRARMEYARKYEKLIASRGAAFRNDHIAFRTFAAQKPPIGIFAVSRLFEALGYRAAGCYQFPDKHLSSLHYEHSNPQFPKIFISELKTWELSAKSRGIISKSLNTHRPHLTDETLSTLQNLKEKEDVQHGTALKVALRFFSGLPWGLPRKRDVLALNEESQFGAWVLVNGYDVNHFTASADSHGVSALSDIDKTVEAMKKAGIPMKPEIEGAPGSKLRQSSTEAVVTQVKVRDGSGIVKMPWTYAYFEIAERPLLLNPATGKKERFEGFLGGQAAQLFEMTRLKKSAAP